MKRLILTVVAALTLTATFAKDEKANNVNNANAYDMTVNMSKLGDALKLSVDQMESVADVHHTFCGVMFFAVSSSAATPEPLSFALRISSGPNFG